MATWGILSWIILGGIAGWLASKVMGTDGQMGIPANIIVGIIGAMLGGWVLRLFHVNVAGAGLIFSMLTAILGACILLWIVGMLTGRR